MECNIEITSLSCGFVVIFIKENMSTDQSSLVKKKPRLSKDARKNHWS